MLVVVICLGMVADPSPAQAASLDPYVTRYLKANEPVELQVDEQGAVQPFSAEDLSIGKHLFDENCKNCHVAGATLPDPTVPLSLEALHHATPPRDTISRLVAYLRQPMTYDGTEDTYVCRQVSEDWMGPSDAEKLAAFILRAAQKAPGWGTSQF
jgi:photosystem II cytochrome c550